MANYGKFTSYEPAADLPGAFNFQTADGKSMLAGGQAALDLKARLDAANAATQTAGDNAAGGFQISGLAGKLHNKGVAQNNADLASVATAGAAPAPVAAPSPTGPQPHMVNGINTGYIVMPDGSLKKHVGGSAGVSKESLEAKAGQGTALPTSQSESTTGGFAPNQEYLDARAANTENVKGVANEARDAEITAQEQGRAVAGDQFVAQTAALQHQQDLANQVQTQVDQAQLVREQAVKEYTGTKIDPDRVFAGGAGFAKRLGAALAAGVGAYAAARGGTPNFAGQVIDNMIERDIHAQEVDLRTKKDAADNALSDLMRRGMSLDQAKNTLGTIQKDWARQQLELAKGASGSDAINAKYDAHIAKLTQDQLDADEKYRQDSLGKATKATASTVMYPQAATAGGLVDVAPDKALQIAGQTAGVEGQVVGTAKGIKELSGGGTGQYQGLSEGQSKNVADIDASLAGLAELEALDTKLGKPTVVTSGALGSGKSQQLGAAVAALGPGVARAIEGDAATKDSMDSARAGLLGTTSSQREAARQAYRQQLERKKQAILEGAKK